MNKIVRIIAVVLGISALIDFVGILFLNHTPIQYTIIVWSVSKTSYLIFKFLMALVLITGGLKGMFGKPNKD